MKQKTAEEVRLRDCSSCVCSSGLNADGTWKRGDALRQACADEGFDLSRPIMTSCGSDITASVLLFGLYLLGKHDFALYDGSWTEWGGDPSTPKATGHA